MQVCAERYPLQEDLADGRRVYCWLHTSDERAGGPVDRRPLEREELAVAEEA